MCFIMITVVINTTLSVTGIFNNPEELRGGR